jgi:hypothetical protein
LLSTKFDSARLLTISLNYDTSFDVVTADKQKLQVAASGTIALSRPDKIRATRHGGFANLELLFDGKTFTIYGKDVNAYLQAEMPGTVDQAVDTLRDTYHRSLPGADLLRADVYAELMTGVTDVKDLGAGVVAGTVCDHLAFRAENIDWQIWIAQGDRPYPCRYVITTTDVDQSPQYTITITDFKTGSDAVAADVSFSPAAGATKIEPADIAKAGLADMRPNFSMGE